MTDLNKIIDQLSKLTVVEAADLSKQLEEKWGVSAAVVSSRFSIIFSALSDSKRFKILAIDSVESSIKTSD